MNSATEERTFQGIQFFQDGEAEETTFFYVPAVPEPDRDADGRPLASFLISEQGAVLQLQVVWDADSEALEQLRANIKRRYPALAEQSVNLQPARLSTPMVETTIGDGKRALRTLEAVPSSGLPPYRCILQQILTADEKQQVLQAFNGITGHLSISYDCTLAYTASIQMTLAGDVARDIENLSRNQPAAEKPAGGGLAGLGSWFGGKSKESSSVPVDASVEVSLADCLEQIESALREGRLILQRELRADPSAQLQQTVETTVRNMAARQLRERVRQANDANLLPEVSQLQVHYRDTEPGTAAISRSADVGSWLQQGDGMQLVKPAGYTVAEPVRPASAPVPDTSNESKAPLNTTVKPMRPAQTDAADEITVRLGFDPADAPLSAIKISCGNMTRTLQKPGFAAVTLPASVTGELVVETQYSRTGANFRSALPEAGKDCALTPALLGLAQITVDGSACQSAGVKKASGAFRYKPTTNGTRATEQFTFSERDSAWIKRWYVITRSPDLGGSINWQWTETPVKGRDIAHAAKETSDPQLLLQPQGQDD